MSYDFDSPYNIPSPEPIYAGSFVALTFLLNDPYSEQNINLQNAGDITFAMTLFGNYNNDIVLRFSKRDKIVNIPRMIIDDNAKNMLTINLFADDTINFEDSWYDFQLTLHSADGLQDSVVGQGKIRVFSKI